MENDPGLAPDPPKLAHGCSALPVLPLSQQPSVQPYHLSYPGTSHLYPTYTANRWSGLLNAGVPPNYLSVVSGTPSVEQSNSASAIPGGDSFGPFQPSMQYRQPPYGYQIGHPFHGQNLFSHNPATFTDTYHVTGAANILPFAPHSVMPACDPRPVMPDQGKSAAGIKISPGKVNAASSASGVTEETPIELEAGCTQPKQKKSVANVSKDPNFSAIRHYLNSGSHLPKLTHSERTVIKKPCSIYKISQNGSMETERHGVKVIYTEHTEQRLAFLQEYHLRYGHARRDLLLQKVTEKFIWNGIKADIEHYVNACVTCQESGLGLKKVEQTLKQIKVVSKAWYSVGMDFIGPLQETKAGNRYILTLMDHYTKWPEAIALPSKDAVTTAKAVYSVYCRFGAPARILTDNGGEWLNKLNDQIRVLLNIKQSLTRAYHPQSDGMVEKFNGTLKRQLEVLGKTHPADWDQNLNAALQQYRIKPHTATRFSPFDMMHTWNFRFDPSEAELADQDLVQEPRSVEDSEASGSINGQL